LHVVGIEKHLPHDQSAIVEPARSSVVY
jgi:hypothetical protein